MQLSVIAPSFKIPAQEYKKTLSLLKKLGWAYKLNEPIFESGHLCAASEAKRWKDLRQSLNSQTDLIWCLRGGYGALHLLPHLSKWTAKSSKKRKKITDLKALPPGFKLLVGFSDITVLHYYLNQVWGWPSLHYRHLNSFVKNKTVAEGVLSFEKSIQEINDQEAIVHSGLTALNLKAKKIKNLKADIVGGNLITLQSLIGQGLPKPTKQFLFLEEIDEPVYKIDRALTQLKNAGWLENVKAILLGSFTHRNPDVEKQTQKFFKQYAKGSSIAIFKGLPCGHIERQKPLFLGTQSLLSRQASGKFQLHNLRVPIGDLGET